MKTITLNFDNLKKDHWSDQQTENAKLILEFVQHLMNNHEFDLVMQKYGDGPYVQHNKTMQDGLGGVTAEPGSHESLRGVEVKHRHSNTDITILPAEELAYSQQRKPGENRPKNS